MDDVYTVEREGETGRQTAYTVYAIEKRRSLKKGKLLFLRLLHAMNEAWSCSITAVTRLAQGRGSSQPPIEGAIVLHGAG